MREKERLGMGRGSQRPGHTPGGRYLASREGLPKPPEGENLPLSGTGQALVNPCGFLDLGASGHQHPAPTLPCLLPSPRAAWRRTPSLPSPALAAAGRPSLAVFGAASRPETLQRIKEVIHSRPPSLPGAEAFGCWGGPGPPSRPSLSLCVCPLSSCAWCFPGEELQPRAHESHSVLGSAGPWLPPPFLPGKMRPGHLLSALKGTPGRAGPGCGEEGSRGGQHLLSVFWGGVRALSSITQ